jgi:hypothetical protein
VCIKPKDPEKNVWCRISASKSEIKEGESVEIRWVTRNANRGKFEPEIPCQLFLPNGSCVFAPKFEVYSLTVENDDSRYRCFVEFKFTNDTTPPPQPNGTCTTQALVNKVNGDEMLKFMKFVTEEPHPVGSSRNKKNAEYELNLLKSFGVKNPHIEQFNSGQGQGYNVVGEIGVGKSEVVIVGGHRDTVPPSPGAVDNEIVIPMEAARVLAECDSKAKANIRFVGFDAEEIGLVGSSAYVNQHSGEKIISMLNFDCEGDKTASVADVYRSSSDLGNVADKCCQDFNLPCSKRGRAAGNSDHASFARKGVPYLFIKVADASSGCGPNYHSSQDTYSGLGKAQLEWAAKLAVCIISELYLEKN